MCTCPEVRVSIRYENNNEVISTTFAQDYLLDDLNGVDGINMKITSAIQLHNCFMIHLK